MSGHTVSIIDTQVLASVWTSHLTSGATIQGFTMDPTGRYMATTDAEHGIWYGIRSTLQGDSVPLAFHTSA